MHRAIPSLLVLALLAACAHASPRKDSRLSEVAYAIPDREQQHPSDMAPAATGVGGDVIPSHADTTALRQAAEAIVHAFAERARAAGADLGDPPSVEVRTTPFLIAINTREWRITMPWWDDLDAGQRSLFAHFAGGDEAGGERLFRAMFYRFFVAHEAAHWLQFRTGTRKETLYENEDDANRIAVAFWKTEPGGEAFLAEIERLMAGVVERIPDPTPPGEDPVAYFGANYRELGQDPMRYGYYQFRFVLDAVRDRERLELADRVADRADP